MNTLLKDLKEALRVNNTEKFCLNLKSLFAHIPYYLYIDQEKYFHSLLQLVATLMGYEVYSELPTDKDRIDLVMQTEHYLYIFELKYNTQPKKALEQIEMRKYKVVLVGLSFKRSNETLEIACETKNIA